MRVLSLLLAVFFCLPGCTDGLAADANDRNVRKIIIDNTITYPGHEFYRLFVPRLNELTGKVYFDSVTLKESRSSRSGSQITIEHREKTLFQTVVYSADQYLDAKARRAASIVSGKLSKAQMDGLFSQGGDLAGDEL